MARDRVKLLIEKLDKKGRGVGYYKGKPVYVNYTVPGDEVEVDLYIIKRGRIREFVGTLKKIVREGEGRIEPKCRYFGFCGGCRFQNWKYEYQLKYKKDLVLMAMEKWGILGEVSDPIPSPNIWFYRNRMDYAISYDGKIGLKEYGSWSNILNLSECLLLSKEANLIMETTRTFMKKYGILGWDLFKHVGFLRYIVIREGKFTGDRLLNIITYTDKFRYLSEFIKMLTEENLVSSIVWGINPTVTDVSTAKILRYIWGKDHLTEKVGKYIFHIHPNAFFQTNSYLAKIMVDYVISKAGRGNKVLDLYSGVGLFSIFLSENFDEVYGIEVEESAVQSANITLKWNDISNVKYIHGKAEERVQGLEDIDVIVLDPPRPGISGKVRKDILKLSPERVIYVSCNPDTMMRDISLMKGYKVVNKIQPIDLFPHTPHVEVIACLEVSSMED